MDVPSDLLTLLAQSKHISLAQRLLDEFSANSGIDATGPVDIQAARQIYKQRARHIERIGYPIHGFPELVKGLEAFTGNSITIFNIRFDCGDYAVFADLSLSELAGVLQFPKRTAAQEAALAESQRQNEALPASRLHTVSH